MKRALLALLFLPAMLLADDLDPVIMPSAAPSPLSPNPRTHLTANLRAVFTAQANSATAGRAATTATPATRRRVLAMRGCGECALVFSPVSVGNIHAAGIGEQPHTGYDELNFDAKFDLDLTPKARLTFAYQQTDLNDIWRTHSTIHGVSYEGTTPGTDRERILDQRRQLTGTSVVLGVQVKF